MLQDLGLPRRGIATRACVIEDLSDVHQVTYCPDGVRYRRGDLEGLLTLPMCNRRSREKICKFGRLLPIIGATSGNNQYAVFFFEIARIKFYEPCYPISALTIDLPNNCVK